MLVLAIDDNPDNLTALKAVLSDRLPETHLLTALNGQKGIELARSEDPDVILLDIVMPGMDGYEVCRKLKADERLKMIPVLFLTALKTDRDNRIKALEAGAEGFLSKPFDEVELSVQIRNMVKIKAAAALQRNDRERLAGLVAERTQALQLSHSATLNLLDDLKAENQSRKKSEDALRESEEQYRLLIEHNRDIIYTLTPEGALSFVSPAWTVLLGHPVNQVIGKSYEVFIHPDDLESCRAFLKLVIDTGSAQDGIEYRVKHLDGSWRWHTSFVIPVVNAKTNETRYQAIARDITTRKKASTIMKQQMDELQRWQNVMLGREDRIAELKREINELALRHGEKPKYDAPSPPLADSAESEKRA